MSKKLLTLYKLIANHYPTSPLHISETLLTSSLNTPYNQDKLSGHNLSGRPNGLWFARGLTWIRLIKEFQQYKYVYEIDLSNTNMLYIHTLADFEEFNRKYPSYWINLDYYNINIVDALDIKSYHMNAIKPIMKDSVILNSAAEAREKSVFYKNMSDDELFRFALKDWAAVARDYDGICIENYIPEILYPFWVQTLDCASGCVWNNIRANLVIRQDGEWVLVNNSSNVNTFKIIEDKCEIYKNNERNIKNNEANGIENNVEIDEEIDEENNVEIDVEIDEEIDVENNAENNVEINEENNEEINEENNRSKISGGAGSNINKLQGAYDDVVTELVADKGECSIIAKGKSVCISDKSVATVRDKLRIGSNSRTEIMDTAKEKLGCDTYKCVAEKLVDKEEVNISFKMNAPKNGWYNTAR